MTVGELKEMLSQCADDMEVLIYTPDDEFTHSMLQNVAVENVWFSEGTEDGPESSEDCVVLFYDL